MEKRVVKSAKHKVSNKKPRILRTGRIDDGYLYTDIATCSNTRVISD